MRGKISRRHAELLIEQGKVTVNGRKALLGERCRLNAAIVVDGRSLSGRPPATAARLLMYHKPRGEIVSTIGANTVFTGLPILRHGRWLNVGRLDVDSEGLLLFTNDGQIANRLAHPSFAHRREYLVRTREELPSHILSKTAAEGVVLAGEQVRPLSFRHRPRADICNQWYEMELDQGSNRVVRRMFKQLGATVNRLIRVRFGSFRLPKELSAGNWQYVPVPNYLAAKKMGNHT